MVQAPPAVAAEPRGEEGPPAGHPGPGDGVADGAVGQPAGVAPVQALLPGAEELGQRGQGGPLLLAGTPRPQEAEVVAPAGVLVGEDHAWGERLGTSKGL